MSNPLIKYLEDKRVKGSRTVTDSEGNTQGGYYTTSKASEIASNLYNGIHSYTNELGETELWTFGKRCIQFGVPVPDNVNETKRSERVRKNTIEKITIK
jgi:hypothetical protein